MQFPVTPRVVYQHNPLEEVKCEIRFPPILKIEAADPAAFQDAVRSEFPFFEMRSTVKLPSGIPSEIAQVFERDLSTVGNKSYAFTSEDRDWVIVLNKGSLSLAYKRYTRWEPFREHLARALESLANIYQPSFFTHTCVRYRNSIRRGPLGLEQTPWAELLQPWASGPLNIPEAVDGVEALQSRVLIRLPGNTGRVDATLALVADQPRNEPAFIIHSHVYNDDRKGLGDVLSHLDSLHRQAGFFFRWCITDRLHRAMRPSPD